MQRMEMRLSRARHRRSGGRRHCCWPVHSAFMPLFSVTASCRNACQAHSAHEQRMGKMGIQTPLRAALSVCLSSVTYLRCLLLWVRCLRCRPLVCAAVCHCVCPSVCRYTHEYGVKKERFNHSLFLVFFQCIGNAAFALARTNFSRAHLAAQTTTATAARARPRASSQLTDSGLPFIAVATVCPMMVQWACSPALRRRPLPLRPPLLRPLLISSCLPRTSVPCSVRTWRWAT
jgi:hypothetical protein